MRGKRRHKPAMPDAAPLSDLAASVRRNDPDHFLCALFAPADKREALCLLAAFQHELTRARAATSTPMTGLIRLQWWRDVVEGATAGTAPRQHEVALPLALAIQAGTFAADDLLAMVDAREAEMEEDMPGAEALGAFLRGSSGGHAVAAGRLLGAPPAAAPALQATGAGYGMALLLRHVGSMAAQGRCLLPADRLEEHALTPADVVRDPAQPGITLVARRLAEESLASLAEARRALANVLPRSAVAAALPGRLAARDLKRVLAPGWSPIEVPPPRGLADRWAVIWGGWRGV